jgi:hypothetical protein
MQAHGNNLIRENFSRIYCTVHEYAVVVWGGGYIGQSRGLTGKMRTRVQAEDENKS